MRGYFGTCVKALFTLAIILVALSLHLLSSIKFFKQRASFFDSFFVIILSLYKSEGSAFILLANRLKKVFVFGVTVY